MVCTTVDASIEQLIADAEPAETLRLRPGDVLVFRYARALSLPEAERIDGALRGWLRRHGFAGVTPLVLDQGADVSVLMKERAAAFVGR